jgi:hypothetical protein
MRMAKQMHSIDVSIALMMKAVSNSETSRRNSPEDSHLRVTLCLYFRNQKSAKEQNCLSVAFSFTS